MKQGISIMLLIVLSIVSCKKNDDTSLRNNQSKFVFGYEHVLCATCSSIHPSNMLFSLQHAQVFKMKDDLLFSGTINHFDDNINFGTTPLGNNALQLSTDLRNNFSAFLLSNPDSTYGLTDLDMGHLVFSITNNGTVRHFNINTDTATLPASIRPYIAQVIVSIDNLYPPFGGMEH